MSQDQLQIFHAAFKPRLKSPKNTRERELDKMLVRESKNLDSVRGRIVRMQKDENIGNLDLDSRQMMLLQKIRADSKAANQGDGYNSQGANTNIDNEKNLKAEQQRIRKFVKEFMTSAELKLE